MIAGLSSNSIRSYVLRQGRITSAQKKALSYAQQFIVDKNDSLSSEETTIDFFALYGNHNPIVVEIGFGMGQSLIEMAMLQPNHNFLGIEVHLPGVAKMMNEIKKHQLNNLRILRQDAYMAMRRIQSNTISKMLLFFPDPWPKKRQQKRRIVNHFLISEVSRALKNNGIWHICTDSEDYAMAIQQKVEESGYFDVLEEHHRLLHSRPVTKYEKRGILLNHTICDLYYQSNN